MGNTRLDIRLDENIKTKAEKASALLGLKSLTDYVVGLMEEDATQVIAKHESLMVEGDMFDRFISACKKAKVPNQSLLKAAAFTEKSGF